MSRNLSALLFILAAPWVLGARCTKPVISNPVGVSGSTGTQLTVTWTTNIPADSLLVYGLGIPGTSAGVMDTGGVTSHSVTVTGLIPGQVYGWGIRSQAIVDGRTCGAGYRAKYGGPTSSAFTKMNPAPSGSLTYAVAPYGPTYVTQGYGMYFGIRIYPLTGIYSGRTLTMTLTGLPSGTTIEWPSTQFWGTDNDTISTTTISGDTDNMQYLNTKEVFIKTSSTTPVGSYTITIKVCPKAGGGTAPTVVATWPLHVVSSSTPFGGVAFHYGTPSSYPPIPNLSTFKAAADTYGEQTCAQDQDQTLRTIRPNHPSKLTPVAACCTYASWFYDGVQVYYNVENLLHNRKNWAQCRMNVAQVYRDAYALVQPIFTFMMFSEGYYTDYLAGGGTGKAADLALLNKFMGPIQAPYNAAYVDVTNLQREVAYVMRNLTHGVALGQNVTQLRQTSAFMRDYTADHVLGMLDQLCLSKNAQYWEFFMVGLQAEALIQYYQLANADPRIPPALACTADWLYTNYWQINDPGAFPYDKYAWIVKSSLEDGGNCMATLNNLISPIYAFLFSITGNTVYQQEGDAIFSAGATFSTGLKGGCPGTVASYLTFPGNSDGKFYSQQYYWGTDYVTWRSAPAFTVTPGSLGVFYQNVNTASNAQVITLNNPTSSSVTINSVALSGTGFSNPGTGTCGANPFTVSAKSSCTQNITFTPTALTSYTGTLTVTPSTGPPYTVPLYGTGVKGTVAAPTFSPPEGTYSGPQTVTISSTTPGAVICYTTNPNGAVPTGNGNVSGGGGTCAAGSTLANNGMVSLSSSSSYLRASATLAGYADSAPLVGHYTITGGSH